MTMPKAVAKPSVRDAYQHLQALVVAAARFVPHQRGEAMLRKWLRRGEGEGVSDDRMIAMMADAVLLTTDLLLSQPSGSGTTAFDRLARSQPVPDTLRQSRYRLLTIGDRSSEHEVAARDVVSGDTQRLVHEEDQPFVAGMRVFGRVAMLGDGLFCLPGAITPLDPAAFAVAQGHPAAHQTGPAGGVRWAEAIYAHVVAHGTLDVPGLNRPTGDIDGTELFEDGDEPVLDLAHEWAALEGGAPDAALLARTRRMVDFQFVCNGFGFAAMFQTTGKTAMATALERLLAVQLETIRNRERTGSCTMRLDHIAHALERAITVDGMPAGALDIFRALRARLPGGAGASASAPASTSTGDQAMEKLMQRIQALRAKTVERGCTEQEALAAAEKVAELLDRHGLSLSELDFRAQPCEGIGIQTTRRRFAPIDSCVPAIAAFFDCRVWVEQSKGVPLRYVFFGLRTDVAAAQYLYELVERAFETESNAFRTGRIYARMARDRRAATNSFQVGLAEGIAAKLHTLSESRIATRRSSSGRDLVPVKAAMVDEEMAKLGLDLRRRSVGRRRHLLRDAYEAGEAAAERFEITPGIEQAA
jgi:hypothetical protein